MSYSLLPHKYMQLIQGREKLVVKKLNHMRAFHMFCIHMSTADHYLITRWTTSKPLHSLCNDSWLSVLISFATGIIRMLNKRFKAAAGFVLQKPKKQAFLGKKLLYKQAFFDVNQHLWKIRYYKPKIFVHEFKFKIEFLIKINFEIEIT